MVNLSKKQGNTVIYTAVKKEPAVSRVRDKRGVRRHPQIQVHGGMVTVASSAPSPWLSPLAACSALGLSRENWCSLQPKSRWERCPIMELEVSGRASKCV